MKKKFLIPIGILIIGLVTLCTLENPQSAEINETKVNTVNEYDVNNVDEYDVNNVDEYDVNNVDEYDVNNVDEYDVNNVDEYYEVHNAGIEPCELCSSEYSSVCHGVDSESENSNSNEDTEIIKNVDEEECLVADSNGNVYRLY